MAVDYLKNYLNIDPNDYSAMQSRIAGTPVVDDQFARIDKHPSPSVNSLRNFGMPQQRSLGDIEAMQMMPRQQPAPQPAPQVDDRYQGLMDQIAALRSQIEGMQAPTEQAPVGAEAPVMADEPSMMDEQDVFSSWRNSPEKAAYDAKGFAQTMDYRPQNYTDPVTGQVFKLDDRSGTFADYYKKTYGRDLTVEDDRFRGSFGSGLGGILDESNSIQAPVSIENRAVGEPQPIAQAPSKSPDRIAYDNVLEKQRQDYEQKIADGTVRNVFEEAKAPAEDIQASIDYLAKLPKMNIPQIPDIEEIKRKMAEANMNFPEPVSYPDQLQAIRDLPPMNQMPTREEIQMAMQNMPTPTAPASSMPKFNLPQMQSFGLPQQIAGGRTLMSDFSPRDVMRMAGGGGIDKAIYDLKFKLNGS
jgi:hypothetical protein